MEHQSGVTLRISHNHLYVRKKVTKTYAGCQYLSYPSPLKRSILMRPATLIVLSPINLYHTNARRYVLTPLYSPCKKCCLPPGPCLPCSQSHGLNRNLNSSREMPIDPFSTASHVMLPISLRCSCINLTNTKRSPMSSSGVVDRTQRMVGTKWSALQ